MMDMGIEISIHALREEGDLYGAMVGAFTMGFLSTPSARRATNSGTMLRTMLCDFYPRPPRGGRPLAVGVVVAALYNFYPRPPRGGRPFQQVPLGLLR